MIYCVEDDESIRELEIYALKSAGFEGQGFSESESFWRSMAVKKPRLILLDIMLPGEDGLSILKRLRKDSSTADIPVIMTTAKGTEYDKVQGLDSGADDYLAKPFGMMEMLSRIRAVLRRSEVKNDNLATVIPFQGLRLDKASYAVYINDEPVDVTKREFELLHMFMSKPGQVFTREVILGEIWGIDYAGETRTVDMHVSTLRTKLKDYGSMIHTVRGIGYRMDIR